jgi:hypothetical protein
MHAGFRRAVSVRANQECALSNRAAPERHSLPGPYHPNDGSESWLFLTEWTVASTLTRVVHSQRDPNVSHGRYVASVTSTAASSSCGSKPSGAAALTRRTAGLTLVETAALLSLSGVLAAAFVPTFVKQLRFSKIAEASQQLDAMYRGTAAYYATDHRVAGHLVRGCLPESAGPTPAEPHVEPTLVDFAGVDVVGRESWLALGEHTPRMLRYSYTLRVAEPGCGPRATPAYPAVTFQAVGDLDGDGNRSRLERTASIASDQLTLQPNIPLRISDRVE